MGTVDEASLYRLLDELRAGLVEPDEVVRRLRRLPYGDLGFARVERHGSPSQLGVHVRCDDRRRGELSERPVGELLRA